MTLPSFYERMNRLINYAGRCRRRPVPSKDAPVSLFTTVAHPQCAYRLNKMRRDYTNINKVKIYEK
jgi:hypothetical protein